MPAAVPCAPCSAPQPCHLLSCILHHASANGQWAGPSHSGRAGTVGCLPSWYACWLPELLAGPAASLSPLPESTRAIPGRQHLASKTRAALHVTLPLSVHTKLLGSMDEEARSALLPVQPADARTRVPVLLVPVQCESPQMNNGAATRARRCRRCGRWRVDGVVLPTLQQVECAAKHCHTCKCEVLQDSAPHQAKALCIAGALARQRYGGAARQLTGRHVPLFNVLLRPHRIFVYGWRGRAHGQRGVRRC